MSATLFGLDSYQGAPMGRCRRGSHSEALRVASDLTSTTLRSASTASPHLGKTRVNRRGAERQQRMPRSADPLDWVAVWSRAHCAGVPKRASSGGPSDDARSGRPVFFIAVNSRQCRLLGQRGSALRANMRIVSVSSTCGGPRSRIRSRQRKTSLILRRRSPWGL
jgi:hypothetical protein